MTRGTGIKKRILIPIVGQGSVIHLIRTGIAEQMKDFCEPVICILWNQQDLIAELRSKGFEVHILPPYSVTKSYYLLRLKINLWYQRKVLKTRSYFIQKKYLHQYWTPKKQIKNRIKDIYDMANIFLRPGYYVQLGHEEEEWIKREKVYELYSVWLSHLNINGLFTVTPFLQEIELLARICRNSNSPVFASIHSFDNVTKRSWPAVFFDHYFVWNTYNKNELQRINPAFRDTDITIAGAPQFDFHFDKNFGQRKFEWLKKMGLPPGKKIILYGGGPASLFPHEPQYLKHLVEAFENGLIKTEAVILFRSHPLDKLERWKKYVGNSPFILYDSAPNGVQKLDYANVTPADIDKLVSTLKYTDVHINLCSTMAVDGSVFDKPQIAPYYDAINPHGEQLLRQMYYQEHFLPIIRSKAIHFAASKEKLIELVYNALESPAQYAVNCKNCVKEIITYTDGLSAQRVVAKLKELLDT